MMMMTMMMMIIVTTIVRTVIADSRRDGVGGDLQYAWCFGCSETWQPATCLSETDLLRQVGVFVRDRPAEASWRVCQRQTC